MTLPLPARAPSASGLSSRCSTSGKIEGNMEPRHGWDRHGDIRGRRHRRGHKVSPPFSKVSLCHLCTTTTPLHLLQASRLKAIILQVFHDATNEPSFPSDTAKASDRRRRVEDYSSPTATKTCSLNEPLTPANPSHGKKLHIGRRTNERALNINRSSISSSAMHLPLYLCAAGNDRGGWEAGTCAQNECECECDTPPPQISEDWDYSIRT